MMEKTSIIINGNTKTFDAEFKKRLLVVISGAHFAYNRLIFRKNVFSNHAILAGCLLVS